jgi:hypothetical protein
MYDSIDQILDADLAAGRITRAEYSRARRQLEQDARDYCREEADNWHRGMMSSDEEEQRVRY